MAKAIIISETTQAIIDKRTDENGIAVRAMMLCTKEHHDGIHVYMGGVDGATNFLIKRGENVAEAIEQAISSEGKQDTTTTEETEEQEETTMNNETETKTVYREVFEIAEAKFYSDVNEMLDQSAARGCVEAHIWVSWPGNLVTVDIDWAAIGRTEPAKALAFAKALEQLAEYAEGFEYNGYTIIDD